MKKIFILIFIGILLVSFLGCARSKDDNIESNAESEIISTNLSESGNRLIDKEIAFENASNIYIDIKAAEVSIKAYDGEDVKVTGELSESSKGIKLNKNGSKIEIVEERSFQIFSNVKDDGSKLDILIPSKFGGDFIFKQGAGTCNMEGLKVKNIDINGGAGKLKGDDIKFDRLNLSSGVGETDLNLKDKCGDMLISGGVGKTNIKMTEVGGNVTYNGGVGEADITIPENSPVKFVKGNGVGKCEINAKTSGEEKYIFDFKVGVGSIKIHN